MASDTSYFDWIAVDWGTTCLRTWAMRGDTAVADAASDDGMSGLTRDRFEPALLALIEPWLGRERMPVIACGMVGARQGWIEAPYSAVPCTPMAPRLAIPEVRDTRLDVRVVPGLRQVSPPDVMRGEETQIAGFLARSPEFDGVLCLPGTHTKWVQISAGEVVSFRTAMTGELFATLTKHSVLQHSTPDGWNADTFAEAVGDAMTKPEALASKLFQIRAAHLLEGATDGVSRLSGLLIGAELAATRPYWLGQQVAIIGDAALAGHYSQALALQGVSTDLADATEITLAGLAAAYAHLEEMHT